MLIGEIEQKKTNITFEKVDKFETCFNALDISGYDSDDAFLQDGCVKITHLNSKK